MRLLVVLCHMLVEKKCIWISVREVFYLQELVFWGVLGGGRSAALIPAHGFASTNRWI
jgi:hypothetical protein